MERSGAILDECKREKQPRFSNVICVIRKNEIRKLSWSSFRGSVEMNLTSIH